MTISKTMADLKKARVFTQTGHGFELHHPSISGTYRWIVHGFRHRLAHLPGFGLHEELIEHFTHDPCGLFTARSYGDRVYELIDKLGLPDSCTPVLYLEVYDIVDDGTLKPAGEDYLNISRVVNRTRRFAPHTTVQRGLLQAAKPSPDFATLMKPVGGFSTWWVPLPASVSSGHASRKYCLDVDAGQASGAHTYGWLARGGRSIEVKGNNSLWMSSGSTLPTASTTSPPLITDLRLRRAGFLLFELQRLEHDRWTSVPQDTDQMINPLAMPLFLDRAETVLVEHVKEHADAIKGVRKPSSARTGKEYPMNTWSKNHHHRNQRFNRNMTGPVLEKDIETVASRLDVFISGRSGLLVSMVPQFGESLSGSVW